MDGALIKFSLVYVCTSIKIFIQLHNAYNIMQKYIINLFYFGIHCSYNHSLVINLYYTNIGLV